MDAVPPQLWLVPTPIGNLQDITLRAISVLQQADAVAAEDTRHSGQLLRHLGIHKPLERLDAHTMSRAAAVLARYPRLAYVCDAGSPGLSDPGAELVAVVLAQGGRVEALPGPTALIPALAVSGLPVAKFSFYGFLPRSGPERRDWLTTMAQSTITTAMYESPQRLLATLTELQQHCGPHRACAVVREISKLHEEVFRGSLAEACEHFAAGVRGELVVVLGPSTAQAAPSHDFSQLAAELAQQGNTTRQIRAALMQAGAERNQAYALALTAGAQPAATEG
jgi:16S rRNA (cytidine1402-2'-O)-methyltransferase